MSNLIEFIKRAVEYVVQTFRKIIEEIKKKVQSFVGVCKEYFEKMEKRKEYALNWNYISRSHERHTHTTIKQNNRKNQWISLKRYERRR